MAAYVTPIQIILTFLPLFTVSTSAFIINEPYCSNVNSTENIAGTSLKTASFYRVTTQNATNRFMTWSYKSHPKLGHRYIVSDNSKSNRYKYEKGGQNYNHAQWYFLPAKGYPGWYHLVNRGIPGEFAAWSYKGDENLRDFRYYLILDPFYANSAERLPKLEYLFRPVKQESGYQLEAKALPDTYISVCNTEDYEGSKRYHLYANNVEDDADKYKQGGDFFLLTLFNFEPIEDVEE